jgi:hypothetical protein
MSLSIRLDPATVAMGGNVEVTTSNCAVTALVLEARALAPTINGPVFNLPIAYNGVTRFKLDPAAYVFIVSFKNDAAKGKATVNVVTADANPMVPPGPLNGTAQRYETGTIPFLVNVS